MIVIQCIREHDVIMSVDISTDLMRAFVAVADRRSFTRAAHSLRRTQAAVSMQVKRLEQITGTRLFERGGRSVTTTLEGERLLGYARRIVALNDEALQAMAESRIAGTVRLGVNEDYAAELLPPVLNRFLAAHPKVAVELETGMTGLLLQHLGDAFQLVLAMHPAGEAPGQLVRRERTVWAGARTFDAHARTPLPLALCPPGCLFRQWALAALDQAQKPWRLTYVSPSHGAIAAAVAAGLAVSVFKASTLPTALRVLGPRDGLPSLPEADLALHRTAELPREARALAEHLLESLRDASSPTMEESSARAAGPCVA
jgi:DNA-binding transcriptional LysR family regulator